MLYRPKHRPHTHGKTYSIHTCTGTCKERQECDAPNRSSMHLHPASCIPRFPRPCRCPSRTGSQMVPAHKHIQHRTRFPHANTAGYPVHRSTCDEEDTIIQIHQLAESPSLRGNCDRYTRQTSGTRQALPPYTSVRATGIDAPAVTPCSAATHSISSPSALAKHVISSQHLTVTRRDTAQTSPDDTEQNRESKERASYRAHDAK
eukprot:scaffold1190_cov393-Prasinococcus_capsulatus_cf.AAC.47